MSEGFKAEGPKGLREPDKEAQDPYMNEEQTLAFVKERGLEPLTAWQPGQPFIYVFEEHVRKFPDFFSAHPEGRKPSLARVDSPTWMGRIRGSDRQGFANESRGQIDYYAIDATGEVIHVGKGNKDVQREMPLTVRPEALFAPDDTLFPKG